MTSFVACTIRAAASFPSIVVCSRSIGSGTLRTAVPGQESHDIYNDIDAELVSVDEQFLCLAKFGCKA